jgi:isoquinoline 1-oxidoreductase beta subunit
VAAFLGFDLEQIVFHTPYIGGSFGRRGSFGSDWVMEGVHIAKACAESIKLVWSREDDIQGGNYRPAYLHRINIGLGQCTFPRWVATSYLLDNLFLLKRPSKKKSLLTASTTAQ